MKFPVEQCECGLDLTTAKPVRVRLGMGPNDEPVGGCPNCWRTYFMVEEPEPVVGSEPAPEPEAPAEEAPAEEAPAEEAPAEAPEPEPETPGEEKKGG